ncbi:MAG: hypothetical protein IJR61_04935, partial [Clostridia bacterium]|nr:hypothetical protein [Clostridia bacterium]
MIFSYDKKPFWQDLDVLHINRLPPRAFFVPYRDANKAISNALPQASDCVTMLDGEWEYKYFRSAMYIAEEDIYSSEGYAVTEIPSCWQAQGIEPPVYINVAFPIPADPPNVPYENPCVIYRKKFSVKREKNCMITFLGVSAAFSLYANGKFVGYSEGSHYVSEFDLSPFLKDGENTLAVLCYKWCNGSYFECQDMFRNNGIFRSVFLTHLPEAYLYDLLVKPVTDEKKRGRVYIKLNVCGTAEIKLTLTDCDGAEIASKHLTAEGGISRCFFTLDKPRLWSAEIPELYRLEVTVKSADGERTVRQPFGFKTVEVKKGVFLFNGKPIKLYGVNHHDTHPDRLSALNKEDMEKDVSLMKSLNINAVRFSHYPPHPYMLELCDKAGLYVVDEADAECHGELFMKEGKNYFSNDPAWKQTLAERADRLFERDKNHASVIMWSLGNESGAGANHIYAYKRLKRKIFNSLVHYEDTHTFPCDVSDVKSFMYSTPEDLSKIAKNSDKPIFLCEYAHCMGVGPGGLKEYLEFFDSEKKMMGGCIWEWAEHAVRQGGKLKYGGDNGEYIHDGNFCVDGMMSPDRELTPSAYEVKNAYRPIKAEIVGNAIRFRNRNLFVSSSIKAVFTLVSDGSPVVVKEENFRFDAGRDKVIPLPFCGDGGECFINIDYYENGSPIGSEQLFLSKKKYVSATTEKYKTEFTETDSEIAFFGKDVTVVFDKITNTVSSVKAFGSEFINQYPQINRYTAYSSYLKGFT